MKTWRSERLVGMTQYLLDRPHTLVSLTYFTDRYQSAGFSTNEDLAIIKKTFEERGTGILEMVPGTAGGVRLVPEVPYEEVEQLIMDLCNHLSEQDRLLPGDYVYLSGLLGEPNLLRQVGRIIASKYLGKQIDVVIAAATKGVPIAQAVSYYLNVPFVIVRCDSEVTKGSAVSMNCVSGSSGRIERMELSKRSLKRGSKVLVADGFVKDGDTVSGMKSMIEEFEAKLVDITVFAKSRFNGHRTIDDYTSLLYVEDVGIQTKTINIVPRSYSTEK